LIERYLFTSESVTEGHPDKVADQISDSILDAVLQEDPQGRVACETLVNTGMVMIAGEMGTDCYVEIPKVARETVRRIGYDKPAYGFDWETCAVLVSIDDQSPDIALGVDREGAGDQGLMFGYACNETPELMPFPIMAAHRLAMRLAAVRKSGKLPYLGPDGKTQVTAEYENGRPLRVDTVVVSSQHSPDVETETLHRDIIEHVIRAELEQRLLDDSTTFHINPTGRFVKGGPAADAGVTGRKIIVDTYGGIGGHGGGCFSGKDPTKVDRSASYAARWVAKNIVAAGLADKCEVQLAYAIGIADPLSVKVDAMGTGKVPEGRLSQAVRSVFDLTPRGIIDALDLRRPIYAKTAAYGHFGRDDEDFTWEKTDRAEALRRAV
jgi:S-adenosylmethionine synthetase